MTDGEPETAVSASLQKIKSIKNQHKHLFYLLFHFIISQTNDSIVDHFDGHFAYLETLDFSFNFLSFLVIPYLHWQLGLVMLKITAQS